ncbi:MAG: hypothetical protein OIN88_10015 [Candidatus Methanoperedens sp.]|nr:hypothetical protein [Candidatus Methanoperedens sp.]MCZ7358480.1 hypothetical protein [Candidatus Methanoperedens sp.]HLB69953.1 hypothetical protein [Candidatus Methanoperedens sp.]
MNSTDDKVRQIEEGLKYLAELDLIDDFYDTVWKEGVTRLLERYKDQSEYRDLSLEETDGVKRKVVEWFGDDYGLAEIDDEFWMVSVGSIDEGGNKWWYKIKLNTDDPENAKKIVLMEKCLPGKYCNVLL